MDPLRQFQGYKERTKRGNPQLILDENGNNFTDQWIGNELKYASSMPQKTSFQFQVYNTQLSQTNNNNNSQLILQDDSQMGTNFNIDQQYSTTTKSNKFNINNQMFRSPLSQIPQQTNSFNNGSTQSNFSNQVSPKRRFNSCLRGGKKIVLGSDNLLPNVSSKIQRKNKALLNMSGQISPTNGSQLMNQTFHTKQNSPLSLNRSPLPPVNNNINQRESLGKVDDGFTSKRNKKFEPEGVKKKDVRAIQYLSAYGDESIGEVIITKENLKQYLEKLNDPEGYDGRVMMKHFQEHFKMWEQRVSKIYKSLVSNIVTEKDGQPNINFLTTRNDCIKQQQDLEEVLESAHNVQLKYQFNNNLQKIINMLQRKRDQFKQLGDYLSIAYDFHEKLDEIISQRQISSQNIEQVADMILNQIIKQGRERIPQNQQHQQDISFEFFIEKLHPYLEKVKIEYQMCKKVIYEYEVTQQKVQNTLLTQNDFNKDCIIVRENIHNLISLQNKYQTIIQNCVLISKRVRDQIDNDLMQIIHYQRELDYKAQGFSQTLVNQLIDIAQIDFHLNITLPNWSSSFKSFVKKFEQFCQLQINKEKDSIEKRVALIKIQLETLQHSFLQFISLFSSQNNQNQFPSKFLSQGIVMIGNQQCQEELNKALQFVNSFANAQGQIMQQLEYIKRKIDTRLDTQQQQSSEKQITTKEAFSQNNLLSQGPLSSQNIQAKDGFGQLNQTSKNGFISINNNTQQQKQSLQNYQQQFNIDMENNNQSKNNGEYDINLNQSQLRKSHYYYPIQKNSSLSQNKNKKKLIIRGFDRALSQANSSNSEQSTQILSRNSNQQQGGNMSMVLVDNEDSERQSFINGYHSALDIKQGGQINSFPTENKQINNLSMMLNEESFELDDNQYQSKRNNDEQQIGSTQSSNRQKLFLQNISQRSELNNLSQNDINQQLNTNQKQQINREQIKENQLQNDDKQFNNIEDNNISNNSQDQLSGQQSQYFHQQKLKRKQQISQGMRPIRVQRKFMQNLIAESTYLLNRGEKRNEYVDVISFNNIPPLDPLGLSSRIINVLKSDLLILNHIQRQLVDLRESNPFTLYIKNIDKYIYNRESNLLQSSNDIDKQNDSQKIKINEIIELMKMSILKVEKGEDIDIQVLLDSYHSTYGLLFCHLFCLAIEQILNFTKLIQIEEIVAKCINRMIDGINFQNMEYLEIIISDNLKKLENIMPILSLYLPEQHSIFVIYNKYNNMLQKLIIQNSIFYANNSVIPNFDDLQLIIQSIQDFLYKPSFSSIQDHSQSIIPSLISETLTMFKDAFNRFQNIPIKFIDPKSRLIVYDRMEKIIMSCSTSTQYMQFSVLIDQNKSNIPHKIQQNNSQIHNASSLNNIANNSSIKKKVTPQQDFKTLLTLLRRLGEYLISKNENVIILRDSNHQIAYICKHNQKDYSNPLEKLINSNFNYIQQEQSDQSQSHNGKNYAEVYKQIVLNSKYFDSITQSQQLHKEQLQNVIYNNNQYEKEGVQIIQGLKGTLFIDPDKNLYFFELFKKYQSQAQIILIDKLTDTKICEMILQPNINQIQIQSSSTIIPCRLQIIWEVENQIQFSEFDNKNEKEIQDLKKQQTHILFEKDICVTSFINSYVKITNENANYSPNLPLKYPPIFNQNLEKSLTPSLPSLEITQLPDINDGQTPPISNIQNNQFLSSPSPINKKISQDSIYQSNLKVIEEENYSSISFNNIDMLKEKEKLKYLKESKKVKQEQQISADNIQQEGSQKTFSFTPMMCENKEEQYTQFRFLIETKQLQVKEDSLKSKNQIISQLLDSNQKKSMEIDEINVFKAQNKKTNKINTDEGIRSKKNNEELKKKSQTVDIELEDSKKPIIINLVEQQQKINQKQAGSRAPFEEKMQILQSDKITPSLESYNNKSQQNLEQNESHSSSNASNFGSKHKASINSSNSRKQSKEQQERILRKNNQSPTPQNESQNKSQDDLFSKDQSHKTLSRQRNSISHKHEIIHELSINPSIVSINKNINKTIDSSKQQTEKSKVEQNSINQVENSSHFQSIEQNQEQIIKEQTPNLQQTNQKDCKTLSIKNKGVDGTQVINESKEKRSKSVISNQSNSNNKIVNSILNSQNSSAIKNKRITIKSKPKKFLLDDDDGLDFDDNTEIKSFQNILQELKTTKINIDM